MLNEIFIVNNLLYGVTEKYDVLFAKIAIFIVHVHVYASIGFVPVVHGTWMKHLYYDYTCCIGKLWVGFIETLI